MLVLMPVRGTLVERMLTEYGADAVLRVDTDELGPEFRLGDYLGVCLPVNHSPQPGDVVVVTFDDGPQGERLQPFTLRIYDELAGEPALLPLYRDSSEELILDGASIWAVVVWMERPQATTAEPEAPGENSRSEEEAVPASVRA